MDPLTPEQQARQRIDAMLVASGWIIQDYKALNPGAGLGIAVCELPLKSTGQDPLRHRRCRRRLRERQDGIAPGWRKSPPWHSSALLLGRRYGDTLTTLAGLKQVRETTVEISTTRLRAINPDAIAERIEIKLTTPAFAKCPEIV